MLLSQNRHLPGLIPHEIEDDVILEINRKGQVLWQWSTLEHYDQLGLSDEGKSIIASSPEITDVFHTNSIQSLLRIVMQIMMTDLSQGIFSLARGSQYGVYH